MFGLHMLAQDQDDIAAVFASKSDGKFDSVSWEWDRDVPRLRGVRAFLRCAPAKCVSYADHTVVIASVLDISVDHDIDPLLHYRQAFTWSIQPRREDRLTRRVSPGRRSWHGQPSPAGGA